MPPMEPDPKSQSEVVLTPSKEILVDEDALSPGFRAQVERLGGALGILIIAALLVSRFRRAVLKEAPRAT